MRCGPQQAWPRPLRVTPRRAPWKHISEPCPDERPLSRCPQTLSPASCAALVSLPHRAFSASPRGHHPRAVTPPPLSALPLDSGVLTLSREPTSPSPGSDEVCSSEPGCSGHPAVTAADEAPRSGGGYFTVNTSSSLGTCFPGSPLPPQSGQQPCRCWDCPLRSGSLIRVTVVGAGLHV